MKLNWFSPLPPAKTDIADYTARLLPFLRGKAEITLWTDQPEWDRSLERFGQVRRYEAGNLAWAELNQADACIYHIGNNPLFHGSIWRVSRRCPGVVVLHDTRLQHFFAGLYERSDDRAGYVAHMELYYGAAGRHSGEEFWKGRCGIDYLVEHYPLTPAALENSLGVVVHTEEAFEKLSQRKCQPVAYIPLAYPATRGRKVGEDSGRAEGPPYQLIVFGHFGPNRRLEQLLEALAALPQREMFRLNIYGLVPNENHLRSHIRSLGLERLVLLNGFVPEATLNRALDSSHIAINLRYPSMGEASGSQLRIWDHALPSLVTKTGWYVTLPEEAVAFVRPESEVADIQAHLAAFLADPERFGRMGAAGRRLVEERHTPEKYVESFLAMVSRAQRFSSCAVAYSLADRVGKEIGELMGVSMPDAAYLKVAKEIYALTNRAGHTLSDNRRF